MSETKQAYLMKFRKCSSFDTLEKVFERLCEKNVGIVSLEISGAYDHRKAELTMKNSTIKSPPVYGPWFVSKMKIPGTIIQPTFNKKRFMKSSVEHINLLNYLLPPLGISLIRKVITSLKMLYLLCCGKTHGN